ncbi:hypothetical protein N7481_001089 [Penicillium waksmanii]|uniref:uncharacterized protein n=1 Tax=Penicillium waksmanii TaxID=69791 RepID=UPI002548167D|nr:uncharacterized protein N7481_001089 [Penicillium waksmanii]KAJ6000680.1 hypothetical protein N7481_001089 [Penicillium waksmanii]
MRVKVKLVRLLGAGMCERRSFEADEDRDQTTDGTNDRATPNRDKNKTNGAEDLKIKSKREWFEETMRGDAGDSVVVAEIRSHRL